MEAVLLGANRISTGLLVCGLVMWLVLGFDWSATLTLHAGLMLLMAAPVVRLVGAIGEELRAGEWVYAALGIVVVVLLCAGVFVALRG
jgi:uncharacterized membrane protein